MKTDPVSLKKLYLMAMAKGWAAETDTKTIAELPGSKVLTIEIGDIKVVDCYFVNSTTGVSTGFTVMSSNNEPLWTMSYGGWYEKKAIPFLKSCLMQAYTARRFYGGRGPQLVSSGGYTYRNRISPLCTFVRFEGDEEIVFDNDLLGQHWYKGGSLMYEVLDQ